MWGAGPWSSWRRGSIFFVESIDLHCSDQSLKYRQPLLLHHKHHCIISKNLPTLALYIAVFLFVFPKPSSHTKGRPSIRDKMLLAEEPATVREEKRREAEEQSTNAVQLIHHTVNNFNISPDKLAVTRINESISTLQQARDLRVHDAETSLKKLARKLNTLTSQYEDLTTAHSSTDHASRIARLDTVKFRTAKAASDAEMETERLAQRAADLSARLQELEVQGVEGDEAARRRDAVDDEVLLRLKVYRSLGIDIERDERDGEWTRAVVRNDRKGDVHVVNMDKKFSRYFYANYFWSTL